MNNFEKPAKIDWSLHAMLHGQPYRTHSLLWEQIDSIAIIDTQDQLEESIRNMDEFPDAVEMLNTIGVKTNGK
jgi:hypothetical protein